MLGEPRRPSRRVCAPDLHRGTVPAGAAGVVVRDRDNHLLEADAVALDIVGLTREQMQATSPLGLAIATLHEDGSPGTERDVSALLGLATPTAGDSRVLGLVRAGSVHWIAVTLRPLCVRAAGVDLVVTSLVDLSRAVPPPLPLSVLYRTPVRSLDQALRRGASGSVLASICMHCKGIRNDAGRWEPLEEYFSTRSSLLFSHGICPACEHDFFANDAPDSRP